MRRFLIHWLVVTVALAVTASLLPGVYVDSLPSLILGGAALGFVNAIVRPVLRILTFPLTIITLGLSLLVVNGAAFALAAHWVEGLSVDNFGWAILGSVVVSLVSWILGGVGDSVRRDRSRDRRDRGGSSTRNRITDA